MTRVNTTAVPLSHGSVTSSQPRSKTDLTHTSKKKNYLCHLTVVSEDLRYYYLI